MRQGTYDDAEAQNFANQRWQGLIQLVMMHHTYWYNKYREQPSTDLDQRIRHLDQQRDDLTESAGAGALLVAERQQEDEDEDE